jgi:pyruvate dehydrogenase E2 component (dihydrolipoamide acetyltransferase)
MYELIIPKMGQGDPDVEIMELKVQVGDSVKINQPIVTIESEKITVTLESEKTGLVHELLVEEGETVKTGTVVCRIEEI